jgi:hypothetical protein
VKNENPKGPPREAEAAPAASPAAAADGAAPAPGHPVAPPSAPAAPASPPPGPASAQATKFIVGEEKIEVTLLLEMVDFSEVAAK